MKEWEFEVIAKPGGGYAAACIAQRIFLEVESLEELYNELKESISNYCVDNTNTVPNDNNVKLIFYKTG